MKILMAFLVTLVAGAWYIYDQGFVLPSSRESSFIAPKTIEIKKPPHFVLKDENQKALGFGVPMDFEVAVFFDGFSQMPVFRNEDPIELNRRDFDTKVAYGKMPYWSGDLPFWSETAPIVGKSIYWLSPSGTSEGTVISVASDSTYVSPVIIKGTPELNTLGSPVFDVRGRVYGILTGADTSKDEVYMTRIERVRGYFEEGN